MTSRIDPPVRGQQVAPVLPAAPRVTEIALTGLRFHVCVGILPHEREFAQPLEIDLRVRIAPSATAVLDYRELYAIVRAVIEAGPLQYLETIGRSIVAEVLALPAVAGARVAIRKPHAAIGGPLDHAEIVVEGSG